MAYQLRIENPEVKDKGPPKSQVAVLTIAGREFRFDTKQAGQEILQLILELTQALEEGEFARLKQELAALPLPNLGESEELRVEVPLTPPPLVN